MKRLTLLACAAALATAPAMASEPPGPPVPTQGGSAQSHAMLMGPGLRVRELEPSVRFYRDGLGLIETGRIPLGDLSEVILGFGDGATPPFVFLVGPAQGVDSSVPGSPSGRIVFSVGDLAATHARLAAAGYTPEDMRFHEESGTRLFFVTDPDGHRVELIEVRPASAESAGDE